ncbi:MAG: signal peptidase I [Spirochaetia bacterium]|nr:signal peptidase I [Spirochaetia bacterium]
MALRDRNLVPEKRPPVRKASIILGIVLAFLLALIGRFLIHGFWIFPLEIQTASMDPVLKKGQVVYVNRRAKLDSGDIVLYQHPQSGEYLLGRAAGLPGDTITMEDRKLIRNGQPVAAAWQTRSQTGNTISGRISPRDQIPELKIAPGTVFVLCDRRDECLDSRLLGAIPQQQIVGRVRLPE